MLRARAEAIREAVFAQQVGESLDFALVGRRDDDAVFLCGERLQLVDEGRDRSMEAQRGPRREVDFRGRVDIFVQHIDRAKLIELEAGQRGDLVLQLPRVQVDVRRGDEAADAGALVALLDFVPPALGLVLQHRRLFHENLRVAEEVEERAVGAGHAGRRTPSRGRR